MWPMFLCNLCGEKRSSTSGVFDKSRFKQIIVFLLSLRGVFSCSLCIRCVHRDQILAKFSSHDEHNGCTTETNVSNVLVFFKITIYKSSYEANHHINDKSYNPAF